MAAVVLSHFCRLRLIHPATLYLAYHFSSTTLRMWGLASGMEFTLPWYTPEPADYTRAFWISEVGLIAMTLGFVAGERFRTATGGVRKRGTSPSRNQNGTLRRSVVVGVVSLLLPFGLISMALYEDIGINQSTLRQTTIIEGRHTETNGYLSTAGIWVAPCLVLLIHRFGARKAFLAAFIAIIVLRMYSGWDRESFLLPAFMCVGVLLDQQRRRWPNIRQVAAGVVLLAVFLGGKGFGKALVESGRTDLAVERIRTSIQDSLSARSEIAFFDVLILTGVAVSHGDYLMGRYYYIPFVMWIPRVYWPEKPGLADDIREISQEIPLYSSGQALTMHGANYANFGIVGVFGLAFAAAFLFARFCRFAHQAECGSVHRLLYIAFSAIVIQFYRDGFMSLISILYSTGFPIYLCVAVNALWSHSLRPGMIRPRRDATTQPSPTAMNEPLQLRNRVPGTGGLEGGRGLMGRDISTQERGR